MTDLYSIKDVARIFDISESRLRYWAQTGFVGPSERRGGRRYYRFRDLIQVRAAKELLDAGLSMQRVRKNLDALRALAPRVDHPASRMRIMSDGETVVARDQDDILWEPLSGQLILDFSVHSLSNHVADILALPTSQQHPELPAVDDAHAHAAEPEPELRTAAPPGPRFLPADMNIVRPDDNPWARPLTLVPAPEYRPVGDRAVDAYALGTTVHNDQVATEPAAEPEPAHRPRESSRRSASPTGAERRDPRESTGAYPLFVAGYEAEEAGDWRTAEARYRQAIERQPTLAAAHTNLGNLLYRQGDNPGARAAYEQALALEPAQAEARYNLGNVLEDLGELELAIAEMRRVCWTHPEFADAHYNLGLLLARTGNLEQARAHLTRYLELDRQSEWAARAREFLAAIGQRKTSADTP